MTAITTVGLVAATTYLPSRGNRGALELADGVAVLQEPVPLPEFSLIDDEGAPFDRKRLEGRWSLLFFGYTHCPDVCPLAMRNVSREMETWPNVLDAEVPQVVFISVDPERDTPERLDDYLEFFDPAFIGVSGDGAEVAKLSRAVGGFFDLPSDTARRTVDHSSRLFLVNPAGDLVAVLDDPQGLESLVRRLSRATRLDAEGAWVPLPPPATNAVAYLTLHNRTAQMRTLIGVESPDCKGVEIHRSVIEDGRVRMEPAGPLEIRPGEALDFSPRALHLMLIEPRRLVEGEQVALHLEFDGGEVAVVGATVLRRGELSRPQE